MSWLYKGLGAMLSWFSSITGSYAVALLFYALIFKIVFLPFSIKQQKNQIKMAKLAPKIELIKAKYRGRNDQVTQRKMQEEIMQLQQSEGYSPLAGCLPLLIQMPIIIFLYQVIRRPLSYIVKIGDDVVIALNKLVNADVGDIKFKAIDQIKLIGQLKTHAATEAGAAEIASAGLDMSLIPNFNLWGMDLSQVPSFKPITLLILIPVYWLSKWAIRPIATNMQKQKQFITDAGHELKTPLAIISANTEVLEMCEGENEWLTSIKNQTVRMDGLVKNLVTLAKADESKIKRQTAKFNLSKAVSETASGFETAAKLANRNFAINVTESIYYRGEESELRQLISILCDNAIKYSDEQGIISLNLYKSGKSVVIEMYNTCEYVDPESVKSIFDRFYRADQSRSRETGGYGIGLSIAKAIVERHRGKIRAFTNGTTAITFKIVL